ncbi:MFS transporter [Bradyrhizobium sp. NP1]|uniref:MFS transporter n=1 Tax=Bradyrhizobium sp. NP1 TaxID=3049772 RepID=UPI0025A51446|nr:MFS transporter [Bradyrhizobium sp. NP1]WJR75350.1 MFS transporter [Bradyrhizobium sp. NP1]
MHFPLPSTVFDKKIAIAIVALAVTQLIGWGTISLPAIVGRPIAADLGMDISSAFAGTSVLYVVTGLCSPFLSRLFSRFGARRVMIGGTIVAIPGFLMLAASRGALSYFLGWTLLGLAGSATLTTATNIMLNELVGRRAPRAIGGLMLVSGLSASVFWPITSLLSDLVGWRGACAIYAGMMLAISLPLYIFALPVRTAAAEAQALSVGEPEVHPPSRKSTFYLLTTAIALNAFVTFGLSAIFIELLKTVGLPPTQAIAFGSALGVIQVSARAMDFVGGKHWDGISTGIVAGMALPVAMMLLLVGENNYAAIATFVLIYGLGSGALAVARATIPLVFYDRADYVKAASRIALPLNLMSAASPPLFIALLTRFGSHALLAVAITCSVATVLLLLPLTRRRPMLQAAASAASSGMVVR